MSTRYVRSVLAFKAANNTAYVPDLVNEYFIKEFSTATGEAGAMPFQAPITTAATLNTSHLATGSFLALYNEDTTNYATVTYYVSMSRGTFSDTVTWAQAASGDTITDDSAAGTYISTYRAAAGDYVRISDAATSGNDGTHLIRGAAADVITLADESTVTADAADAVTMSFESRNKLDIEPGEFCVLSGFVPAQNISLIADTAAVTLRVLTVGA